MRGVGAIANQRTAAIEYRQESAEGRPEKPWSAGIGKGGQ